MTAAAAGIKYSVSIRYRGTDCNKGAWLSQVSPEPDLKGGTIPLKDF